MLFFLQSPFHVLVVSEMYTHVHVHVHLQCTCMPIVTCRLKLHCDCFVMTSSTVCSLSHSIYMYPLVDFCYVIVVLILQQTSSTPSQSFVQSQSPASGQRLLQASQMPQRQSFSQYQSSVSISHLPHGHMTITCTCTFVFFFVEGHHLHAYFKMFCTYMYMYLCTYTAMPLYGFCPFSAEAS